MLPLVSLFLALLHLNAKHYKDCHMPGHFALTFDDAPSENAGILLNTLTKHNVPAAFFITTNYLTNPNVLAYLRLAKQNGHTLGLFIKYDPTLDKPDNKKEVEWLKGLIEKNTKALRKYIDLSPTFLRFSYPGPPRETTRSLEKAGFTIIEYNLDSEDYRSKIKQDDKSSVFEVFKQRLDQITPPALASFISVQRDSVLPSAEQTDQIICYILEKGYEIVSLEECVGLNKGNPEGPLDFPETEEGMPVTTSSKEVSLTNSLAPAAGVYSLCIVVLLFSLL